MQEAKFKKKLVNMTEGKPIKIIFRFALPIFIIAIVQNLYSLVDGKIVGDLISIEAYTAVGATAIVTQVFYGILTCFANGFSISVANRFGCEDYKGVRKNTKVAIILLVIIVIVIEVLQFLLIEPILHLLNTPENLIVIALPYLKIVFMGMPFVAFQSLFAFLLQAVGNSFFGMVSQIISVFTNLIFSLFFVLVFNMGIVGVALGTVVSQLLSFLLTYIFFKKIYKEFDLKENEEMLEMSLFKKIFKMGFSLMMMAFVVNIGSLILQYAINGLGDVIITAHTTARRIDCFMMLPMTSITNAVAVFTAQNYGAGKPQRIFRGMTQTFIASIAMNLITIVICILFGKDLLSFFSGSKDVMILDIAYKYLIFNVSSMTFLASLFILKYALIGVNYYSITLFTSFFEFGIKLVVSLVLVNYIGYDAITISEPASWLLMSIIMFVFWCTKIKKIREIKIDNMEKV